ncbi:VOC family protein [Micromonospora sp. WMMA1363]|uniref:VOC family protein n=1 Tax=Micromonospora sp. WMMA1363 TaxID=3053985 RepID=UPI00259C8A0D|nr:VOC family protein [Micromonospora sp. WMMA1363]MDM4722059.1 VOC family protein [Micromonospora sp. WMMA1363]
MSTVPPGTPCWTDLATPGLTDARRFYPELFGWTGRVMPEPEAGGYTVFLLHGQAVAGVGPPAIPDQVPIWSVYVATDDADLVAGRVERAGGQVVVPPFEVFDRGRMAVFSDPAGAAFSVWQPMAMPGGEVFDVPGALSWTELVTPDPGGAKAFYELVFGWQPDDQPAGGAGHTGWRLGSRIVAGMTTPLGDAFPTDASAYWSVYFGSADVDDTAARVATLGGTILVPPRDIPAGRYTALRDPQGALFNAITRPARTP